MRCKVRCSKIFRSREICSNFQLLEMFLNLYGFRDWEDVNCLQNHGKLCSFFSFLELLLSLSELGQVESSNFLSLFNLLFVCLDLQLQLSSQLRHTILVFPILSLSKSKFLPLALCTLEGLCSFTSARLCCSKFRLKLTDLSFKLGHCCFSTFHCCIFSISKATFKFAKLVCE